jgi:hypothetical protein
LDKVHRDLSGCDRLDQISCRPSAEELRVKSYSFNFVYLIFSPKTKKTEQLFFVVDIQKLYRLRRAVIP